MVNSAYNTYKNNAVLTASSQELTLMLYNGAIKFCNQALQGIQDNKVETVNNDLKRVQDIIDELRITLNTDIPIAAQFDQLYDYMNWRLMQANMNKDQNMIEEVLGMLREFRDTWKEAMTLAKSGQKTASGE